MDLLTQLYDLAVKMPPSVSAVFSVVTWFVIWKLSHQILNGMKDQNKELKTQSDDLGSIKVQTTKTNGTVGVLTKTMTTHEALDEERHQNTKADIIRNRTSIHNIRDHLSSIGLKGLLTKRGDETKEERPT
jgi:hypothetical protein